MADGILWTIQLRIALSSKRGRHRALLSGYLDRFNHRRSSTISVFPIAFSPAGAFQARDRRASGVKHPSLRPRSGKAVVARTCRLSLSLCVCALAVSMLLCCGFRSHAASWCCCMGAVISRAQLPNQQTLEAKRPGQGGSRRSEPNPESGVRLELGVCIFSDKTLSYCVAGE